MGKKRKYICKPKKLIQSSIAFCKNNSRYLGNILTLVVEASYYSGIKMVHDVEVVYNYCNPRSSSGANSKSTLDLDF